MLRKLSKSARKFLRREKARIRREILDFNTQEEMIKDLYSQLYKKVGIKSESNLSLNKTQEDKTPQEVAKKRK